MTDCPVDLSIVDGRGCCVDSSNSKQILSKSEFNGGFVVKCE